MASTKNLVIDQGATFNANIQYLDTNKNPISLTGYSVRSKMRTSYDSPNAAIISATVTNASTGNISLYLDAANTSLLHYGRYVYDVEAYSSNTVIRIQEGAITVTPGVSGNSVGTILKQTLNSLVNGSYSVTLDANGTVQLPNGAIIYPGYPGVGYLSNISTFTGEQVYLTNFDGTTYIGIAGGNIPQIIAGNVGWTFLPNGSITFPDGNSQTTAFVSNNYINKSLLKSIVANSMSWSEFQANIAVL